jgi:glycosidase
MKSQMSDPGSIRSFYKTMLALRAGSDVLKLGAFIPVETGKHLFIYRRELDGYGLTILLNFSGSPKKASYDGDVVLSTYGRKAYDGLMLPYEAVILGGEAR